VTFINQQRKLIYIRLSNVIKEVTLHVLLIYIRLSNVITEENMFKDKDQDVDPILSLFQHFLIYNLRFRNVIQILSHFLFTMFK
jgi:hypothetical protein